MAGGAEQRLAVGAQRLRGRHLHRVRVLGLGRRGCNGVAVLVQKWCAPLPGAIFRGFIAAALLLARKLGRLLAVPLAFAVAPDAHHAILLKALVVCELNLKAEELIIQL